MPHTRKKSCYTNPSSSSNKLFFDVISTSIIIQRESEKQILNKKFSSMSDFKIKKIQRVRFWFKSFTTRQTLDCKKYNALDFDIKFFRLVIFLKNVCIQKTNSMQTSRSIFEDRIEQVKKTEFETKLIKFVDCFLDGHGTYTSNLVSFKIESSWSS